MTYMRFSAEMPNGDIHRGLRRLVVGHGIDAKMTAGTLELSGMAMPVPQVSASFSYRIDFTVDDLINNTLVVEHGLDEDCPLVQVWNSSGEVVQPDKIRRVSANTTAIDLASFGNIEGNWEVVLIK